MGELATRLSVEDIWKVLERVLDPEIPAISLVDLGVIRDVAWQGDTLVIGVSPTYSGCPATAVINFDIETALRAHGLHNIELQRRLSPPWTTDWMSDQAHEKLRAYGIAPPVGRAGCPTGRTSAAVACPQCNSTHTRRVSQFGSTPCKASFSCKDCLEPFEYFKCH